MNLAEIVVLIFGIYAAIGLIFGIAFVTSTADPGIGFRLIILPGAAALWPLLIRGWLKERRP